MTHGQCDARPRVTFPAVERNRPLAGAKLYCLLNRGTMCVNNLPKVVTWLCTVNILNVKHPKHFGVSFLVNVNYLAWIMGQQWTEIKYCTVS